MSDEKKILGIETSNPTSGGPGPGGSGVALGVVEEETVRVIGVEHLRSRGAAEGAPARGGHDDDLMPAVDRLFKGAGVTPRSGGLWRVGVSVGPGGYTGLRVACATGKMIAEACGCGCVAVETARVVLASVASERRSAGRVAIALASKGETAWIDVFGPSGERPHGFSPGVRTSGDIETLASLGVRTLVGDQFLPASMRSAAQAAGIVVVPPTFDPAAVVELAFKGEGVDPAMLNPMYPREPDAVTLWRARGRGQGR